MRADEATRAPTLRPAERPPLSAASLAGAPALRRGVRAQRDPRDGAGPDPGDPLALRAAAPSRGVKRPPAGPTTRACRRRTRAGVVTTHREPETAQIQRMIEPLASRSSRDASRERVNVLIPTIDLEHLFGGYIAKFNLARRLAEAGRPVRIVTVDPTPPLPGDWQEQVESYAAARRCVRATSRSPSPARRTARCRSAPTTASSRRPGGRHTSRGRAVAETSRERFLYMIQEYEPLTVRDGSLAGLAMQSLRASRTTRSSRPRSCGITSPPTGTASSPPGARRAESAIDSRSRTRSRRSAARPPPSSPRGEPAPALLRPPRAARRPQPVRGRRSRSPRAIEEGVFGEEWQFFGIGSTGPEQVDLGGAQLELLPRTGARHAYGELLGRHDLGVALMDAPHPSLVPIEMASAGMLAVTTTFDTKTAGEAARRSRRT